VMTSMDIDSVQDDDQDLAQEMSRLTIDTIRISFNSIIITWCKS